MFWVMVLWKGWFSGVGAEMCSVLFFLLRGRNQHDTWPGLKKELGKQYGMEQSACSLKPHVLKSVTGRNASPLGSPSHAMAAALEAATPPPWTWTCPFQASMVLSDTSTCTNPCRNQLRDAHRIQTARFLLPNTK